MRFRMACRGLATFCPKFLLKGEAQGSGSGLRFLQMASGRVDLLGVTQLGSSQISTAEDSRETEPTDSQPEPDQLLPDPVCERFAPESGTVMSSVDASGAAAEVEPIVLDQGGAEPVQTLVMDPPAVSPRPRRALAWLLWGVSMLVVTLLSAGIGSLVALVMPLGGLPWLMPAHQRDNPSDFVRTGLRYRLARPVTLLVMGIDRVPEAAEGSTAIFDGRSDTMLLVRFDPSGRPDPAQPAVVAPTLNLLSIPRDTRVEIPGVGVGKINSANAAGGSTLAAQTVSQTLNGVAIDRYLRLDTHALVDLVDLLGGVEVYVPKRMRYVDQTQKLNIDLQPGLQTLSGLQAMHFARFRHDQYGDIGRVQRQQILLKALSQKLTDPGTLPRIPEVLSRLPNYINTNLSPQELLALAYFGLELKPEQIHMVMLPGQFGSTGDWLMDDAARDQVMQQFFEVTLPEAGQAVKPQSLRIAIQNASGDPKVARSLARYLSAQGFYSLIISQDWPQTQAQTEVVAQRGDLRGAEAIRAALGVGRVSAQSTGDLESDITIRLGADWQPPAQ